MYLHFKNIFLLIRDHKICMVTFCVITFMKSEIKVHNTSFIFTGVIDELINGTLVTDVTTNYMDVSSSINIPLVSYTMPFY